MTKILLVETAPVENKRDIYHIEQFTEHTHEFKSKEREKNENSLRIESNAVK